MASNPQGKNWVFTLNNPSDITAPCQWASVRYMVFQQEIAPGTGTPHLQGYVVFHTNKRLTALKKLDASAHWELRKGTHEQAREYSLKEETRAPDTEPVEFGEPPVEKGKRNDLMAAKAAMDAGISHADFADQQFGIFARYPRLYQEYSLLRHGVKQRDWKTEVTVYWGTPGSGKTRRALHEAGPSAYWLEKPAARNGAVWFDGYNGEEHVVIDEFYGWIPRDLMQRMCDRYPLNVQIKGGSVKFLAKKIWITSNQDPISWWSRLGLGSMARRMECVVRMDNALRPWSPSDTGSAEEPADVVTLAYIPITQAPLRIYADHSDNSNIEYTMCTPSDDES